MMLDTNTLNILGYRNLFETRIHNSDPEINFKDKNINDSLNMARRFISVSGLLGNVTYDDEEPVFNLPASTLLFHGRWVRDLKDIDHDINEYRHFGLFPLISSWILTETLKYYNYQISSNSFPVIYIYQTLKPIEAQATVNGCDDFINDSVPNGWNKSPNALTMTMAPRYSSYTKNCSSQFKVEPAYYELCLLKDYLKDLKLVGYIIPDIEKLMKNCNNPKFPIVSAFSDIIWLE